MSTPGPGETDESRAREFRGRRRDFIRAHHPDRGGDTDFFTAGLRAFDTGGDGTGQPPKVVFIKRSPWLIRLAIVAARRIRYGPRPSRVR